MSRGGDSTLFFGDEDFVWVEPALETAPTVAGALPAPLAPRRPRRGQSRTLAGDLARLRTAVGARTAALPPRVRALLAAGVLVVLVVLALLVTFRGGQPAPERNTQTPKADSASKAAANAAPAIRTLKAGERGPAVADLQRALGALGLYLQGIDGAFGDSTASAVLAFQSEHGLVADGVAGPATMATLVEILGANARSDASAAEEGLAAALAAGRLSRASADRYRTLLAGSLERLEALPPGRVPTLALVFHSVAALAPEYDERRALTLFSMLDANAEYLAKHPTPSTRFTDMRDSDGVVYRFLPEHGFQFHPIANFAHLNRLVSKGKTEAAERLAYALVARGVRSGNSLLWEYYFPFGGPTRWTSGFAQAIAAQALAESSRLLHDPKLADAARAAYRGISRGLWLEVAGGPWVREYGFTDMPILNAQLQSILSLHDYVDITGDADARETVAGMEAATRAVLAQFDTACWSRYSLGGSPASLHYHTYHVHLLEQLGAETGDPLWSETAARWQRYRDAGGC